MTGDNWTQTDTISEIKKQGDKALAKIKAERYKKGREYILVKQPGFPITYKEIRVL